MLILLDRAAPTPLYLQVYRVLRDQILKGQLPAGQRLPASRTLANELCVARNVVLQAYDQLLAEGLLTSRHGAGTFVGDAGGPPERHSPLPAAIRPSPRWLPIPLPDQPRVAIDFRSGQPAGETFPRSLWGRLLQQALRELPDSAFGYGPVAGDPLLREALIRHLSTSRGILATPDEVTITAGTTQGLALVADLLVQPGDRVAVENPSHPVVRAILQGRGAQLVPIGVDEAGLCADELVRDRQPLRLIYVTPSHQYPTGAVMSLQRRRALVALARQAGAVIVEDDYDSEVRHAGHPLPALQGMAPERVIYLSSMSKLLAPTLRLGYAVLPPSLATAFCQVKHLHDYHSPGVEQRALARFVADGHLQRHLARLCRLYRSKRNLLVATLQHAFGQRAVCRGDATGLHLWLELRSAWTGSQLMQAAAQAQVGVTALEAYWMTGTSPPSGCHLILGYGSLSPAEIAEGIARLAAIEATPPPPAELEEGTCPC